MGDTKTEKSEINKPDHEEAGSFDPSLKKDQYSSSHIPEIPLKSRSSLSDKAGDVWVKPSRQSNMTRSPLGGIIRVILFLVGIGLLVGGLSLAVPSHTLADPYLVRALLILVIFGSVALFWSRQNLMKIAKMAGLWILIIAGVSGFYLFQSEFGSRFRAALDPSAAMVTNEGIIIHRSADGHFWVKALINGEPIRMMVDTGASNIVLSPADARLVGINSDNLKYSNRAETANGPVALAKTKVQSIRIGDALLLDVSVTVNSADMRGSLFGLSALDQFSSFEFRGEKLILRQ